MTSNLGISELRDGVFCKFYEVYISDKSYHGKFIKTVKTQLLKKCAKISEASDLEKRAES